MIEKNLPYCCCFIPEAFSIMAGLLTFPNLTSFPPLHVGAVDLDVIKLSTGITAAGTVPEFHRIPF
jgi:hypothetical protein